METASGLTARWSFYRRQIEAISFEYGEVISSERAERLEELADMIEVIRALAKVEGKTLEEIVALADQKRDKRGGFDKKIFLEKVVEKA